MVSEELLRKSYEFIGGKVYNPIPRAEIYKAHISVRSPYCHYEQSPSGTLAPAAALKRLVRQVRLLIIVVQK